MISRESSEFILSVSIVERSPPIEEVIQSGVVPRFVEFLVREDFPQLQVQINLPTFITIFLLFLIVYLIVFGVWLICL